MNGIRKKEKINGKYLLITAFLLVAVGMYLMVNFGYHTSPEIVSPEGAYCNIPYWEAILATFLLIFGVCSLWKGLCLVIDY